MKKHLLYLTALLGFGAFCVQGAVITSMAPGEVASQLADYSASETELAVSGPVNLLDLEAIATLSKEHGALTSLDLSAATIMSTRLTGRDYFGLTYLPALELPMYIFAGTNFEQVKLPATLTEIGDGAFSDAALKNVSVPASVTKIGDYAFYNCSQLKTADFGAALQTLGKGCFSNCASLESVNLASTKVTTLPERVFAGCVRLESLELPTGLESVGPEAFAGTGISILSLSRVRRLEPFSLSSMPKLKTVGLNADGEQGEGVLANNAALETVSGAPSDLPDAFAAGCTSLDASEMAGTVASIGQHALAATAARELTLGSTLATVSREAFSGMQNLSHINAFALGSNVPTAGEGAFDGIEPSKIKLLVNDADQSAWKADPQWSLFDITSDPNTLAETIVVESSIMFRLEGDILHVTAPEKLRQVTVYALDGRLVADIYPESETASLHLPGETAVIARAATATSAKSTKILLR